MELEEERFWDCYADGGIDPNSVREYTIVRVRRLERSKTPKRRAEVDDELLEKFKRLSHEQMERALKSVGSS